MRSRYKEKKLEAKETGVEEEERRAEKRREVGDLPHGAPRAAPPVLGAAVWMPPPGGGCHLPVATAWRAKGGGRRGGGVKRGGEEGMGWA